MVARENDTYIVGRIGKAAMPLFMARSLEQLAETALNSMTDLFEIDQCNCNLYALDDRTETGLDGSRARVIAGLGRFSDLVGRTVSQEEPYLAEFLTSDNHCTVDDSSLAISLHTRCGCVHTIYVDLTGSAVVIDVSVLRLFRRRAAAALHTIVEREQAFARIEYAIHTLTRFPDRTILSLMTGRSTL